MIKINDNTVFNVLKPDVFIPDTVLLDKYNLWLNTAMTPNHVCFGKGFGEGFYGAMSTVWFGFNTATQKLHVNTSAMEDMVGLHFSETDLSENREVFSTDELECAEYTIETLKTLADHGIIALETAE